VKVWSRISFPVVAIGVAIGALLWLAGQDGAAAMAWTAVTAVVLVTTTFGSLQTLRKGSLGVDVVALLALAGSLALDELFAGAVIALMVASGEALEAFAHRRAQRDLSALLSLAPSVAHRVTASGVETIPVEAVAPGDLLLVKPGEVVPVDGLVDSGEAVLDESVLTGEPLPVTRAAGEPAQSGSVNAGGAIHLRARSTAADSAYAGIVRLVESAGVDRTPFVRLADRYALLFVPVTLVVAGTAWAVSGDPIRALAVLVVATPCPLVLAAPVAIVSGISRAARSGVIVKDGAALEALAGVETVLFDKTGTLTAGQPRVVDVEVADGWGADTVVGLAASLEQASPHVLATAVVAEAARRGAVLAHPTEVDELPGSGIRGRVGDHEVAVGSSKLVVGDHPPGWAEGALRRASRSGWTSVFVEVDGRPVGALLLGDEVRTDTPRAIRSLRRAGVRRIVMVTGDHAAVADPIGFALGLDRVYADRSPAEKVDVIRSETAGPGLAAMVGDGVNDAPALAASDLGVAMGARGATATSEAADVVLVVDRLDRLADGVRVAVRTEQIARQSVVGGMALSFVAMVFAAFGAIPPAAGAVLQELIDVAAIASALRVLRRPPWEAKSTVVPEIWARQLHEEHSQMRGHLDRFRAVADELEDMDHDDAVTALQAIAESMRTEILHHEHIDEREVYPAVAESLGGDDPLAAMSRTHQEIFHLASVLERLVADTRSGTGLAPSDKVEARRLIYALDAILRLHFAQEEELFSSLSPDTAGHLGTTAATAEPR
jgi:heavy metal translocating P-type ATPase